MVVLLVYKYHLNVMPKTISEHALIFQFNMEKLKKEIKHKILKILTTLNFFEEKKFSLSLSLSLNMCVCVTLFDFKMKWLIFFQKKI